VPPPAAAPFRSNAASDRERMVAREIDGMRTQGFQQSTKPQAMAGVALMLALEAFGIFSRRQARTHDVARQQSLAAPRTRRNWLRLFLRVAHYILLEKNFTFIAAGAAFKAFLAIPATVAVLASLSLLIFGPVDVERVMQPIENLVPPYFIRLLSAPHSQQTLGIGLLIGLIIDLWSVHSGSSCMFTALSLTYGEKGKRSFFSRQAAVLVLAAITVPFMLVSLLLLLVLPSVLEAVPLSPVARTALSIVRWPILMGLFVTMLAAVYSYAPHNTEQRWRWMSWGAVVATAVWTAGSAMFSVFVTEFVPYDPTYGALGSVIGLLAWLNFTAVIILMGAKIDAEIEREQQAG
jgi:membrane protein